MWGFWFVLSGICFGAAAYLLKKRSAYVYAPKDVIYSTANDAPKPSVHIGAPAETAPIEAEYSVDPRATPQPTQTASFFSEMSGAINAETTPNNPPVQQPAAPAAEESERTESLKNIRFFDS